MLRHRSVLVLACVLAVACAGAADAKTYRVAGKQIVVDEDQGTSKMRGGLIGGWAITAFEPLETAPVFHARGTETFEGCLDRRRDRSCAGDPKGTLEFTFDYWAAYASEDPASLIWGTCVHPIVNGTGGFAGAQGVIAMVDMPTPSGVQTRYEGTITLPGPHAARRLASATRTVGRGCGPT